MFIVCHMLMVSIRFTLLFFMLAAPSLAVAETLNFEQATEILGESCGKDIDDNCRGVNLDSTRLKDCFRRNGDSISPKCRTSYPQAFSAIEQRISARATLSKLCNYELNHFCADVRQDAAKGLQCLLEQTRRATPNCNKAISAAGYR